MGKNNRNNKKRKKKNRNKQVVNNQNRNEVDSSKKSIKGYVIGIIACLPFLAFGVAFIFAYFSIDSSMKSCTEETVGVVGKVTKSKSMKRASRFWYIQRNYKAKCTYVVNGKKVVENIKLSKKISEGQRVRIRYNPKNPEEKYIVGYEDTGNIILLIFGIVWSALILFIIFALVNGLIYRKTGVDLLLKYQESKRKKRIER